MNKDRGICPDCQQEYEISDWPFCPHGKPSFGVITDEIPGGIWIRHGICNEDGTPKKYYSKSEMRKAAFEKGLTQGDDTPKLNQRIVEEEHKAAEARYEKEKSL